MEITQTVYGNLGILIVALIVLLIFFFLINHFTGGRLVKILVCNLLFWLPYGVAVTKYCSAVPV